MADTWPIEPKNIYCLALHRKSWPPSDLQTVCQYKHRSISELSVPFHWPVSKPIPKKDYCSLEVILEEGAANQGSHICSYKWT